METSKCSFLQMLHVGQSVESLVHVCKVAVLKIFLKTSNKMAHIGVVAHHFHLECTFSFFDEWNGRLSVEAEATGTDALCLYKRSLLLVHH